MPNGSKPAKELICIQVIITDHARRFTQHIPVMDMDIPVMDMVMDIPVMDMDIPIFIKRKVDNGRH